MSSGKGDFVTSPGDSDPQEAAAGSSEGTSQVSKSAKDPQNGMRDMEIGHLATGTHTNQTILEARLLNEEDVKEWCMIYRRIKWNVYPTDAEVSRWYSLLPMVVTTDCSKPPVTFPYGSFRDFKAFADSVCNTLSYRIRRMRNGEDVINGVRADVYKKRTQVVSALLEAKKGDILTAKEVAEWADMRQKLCDGVLFSYDEERLWFKRFAIIDEMEEKDFVPFGVIKSIDDFYVHVSSGLRENRRQREKKEEELPPEDEEEDEDGMRADNNPEAEPQMSDMATPNSDPLSVTLLPMPEFGSPTTGGSSEADHLTVHERLLLSGRGEARPFLERLRPKSRS